MLIKKMDFQYNFRMSFLVMVTFFVTFLVITILQNIYAENDLDIEIPFYYFYNYQNLDNHNLESNNIIPNQFIVYLQDNKVRSNSSGSIELLLTLLS